MKKFLLKSLLLLPLLLLVMGVNVWIDPLHLISNSYYEKAGALLAHNSVEYGDCDDRELMIQFLKYKTGAPIVILGSSRTAVIDSSEVGGPVLNLSLASAATEDMIATYGLYISGHKQPQKLVLGIDPYSFNEDRNLNTAKGSQLVPYYNTMLKKLGFTEKYATAAPVSLLNSNFMNIISFKYFQTSLQSIWKKGYNTRNPIVRYGNKESSIKNTNGTLSYRADWQANPADVDISVARDISNDALLGINGFHEVSAERTRLLTRFLEYLADQKIEVVLFLAPYHPMMWKYIQSQPKYSVIGESEKVIRQIAKDKKLEVIASFDPAHYNLSSSDYYDAVHLKPGGLKKVFTADSIP